MSPEWPWTEAATAWPFTASWPGRAGAFLKKGGAIYLEIGWDQGLAVEGLLAEAGFQEIRTVQDLAGKTGWSAADGHSGVCLYGNKNSHKIGRGK